MVNAFPSSVHQSGLDLANRNILWTSLTSAGIKIPLPIYSYFSISLVSKKHAGLVSQNCPDLNWQHLYRFLLPVLSRSFRLSAWCTLLLCGKMGGGGGGGGGRDDNTICTPFFLQTTFAFTQASFTVTPTRSITPSPNKNFGRRQDFAWTLFCIKFCSY